MKKWLALMLTAAFALNLAACSSQKTSDSVQGQAAEGQAAEESSVAAGQTGSVEADSEQKEFEGVTINIAYSDTGLVADAYAAQFKLFEEKTGAKIEIEKLASDADETDNTLQVRAATGNLPDIWASGIGAKMKVISPKDNMYDLSGQDWLTNISADYLEKTKDKETGGIYIVPQTTSNVAGVFYNKQVYSDLDLEIPLTWEEFLENCETIKNNSEVVPCASPYSTASGVQILFLAQYYYVQSENPGFAAQYTNKEIELHDSPAYMRGLEKMYDIWEKGYQMEDPLTLSFEDASLQLAEGEAAMLVCRTNVLSTMEGLVSDKSQLENIGFFPLPDEDPNNRGVAIWLSNGWALNKNIDPEKEECALAFLEFLTTNEAVDAYCSVMTPTGIFNLNGVSLPDNVSAAVKEAQSWIEKSSTPVMEYSCDIKGSNMATILQMCGTGEYTPEEAIAEIEKDNEIDAQQKGIANW